MAVTSNGTRVLEKKGIKVGKRGNGSSDLVTSLQNAHVRNLSRLANLSVPVVGGTTTASSFTSTVDEILAHGATTTLFGEIFSLIQKNELTREDLDHRLLNWVLRVPGVLSKFEKLPEEIRRCVEEFRLHGGRTRERGSNRMRTFKKPMNPTSVRRVAGIRDAWKEQCKVDGGLRFPGIVENTGDPVMYVEKLQFKNWGETVESTPAVFVL
jgi:hypothetical protein